MRESGIVAQSPVSSKGEQFGQIVTINGFAPSATAGEPDIL
jgi:hypothetical protein